MNYSELLSAIQTDIQAGKLKGALGRLQTLSTNTEVPKIIKPCIHYDIGVLFYKYLGNGVQARNHFKKVIELAYDREISSNNSICELVRYAQDNLLLLCLSFDEFNTLSNDVNQQSVPGPTSSMIYGIAEMESKGNSWVDVMGYLACYAGDEMQDNPLMASVFQLMLKNRNLLRLSDKQWRQAIRTYGETIRYMLALNGHEIETKSKQINPEEIIFIGDEISDFFTEFLEKHPSDQEVQNLSDSIADTIDSLNHINEYGIIKILLFKDNEPIFIEIQKDLTAGNYDSALRKLNKLKDSPEEQKKIKIQAHYYLGMLFSEFIGNGRLARINFMKALELSLDKLFINDNEVSKAVRKCQEMLLYFCLSYEEFETHAKEFKDVPKEDAVSMIIAGVIRLQFKNHAWHEIMSAITNIALEAKNFSLTAAIIQLMLSNREMLGIKKDPWKIMVKNYGDHITIILAGYASRFENSRINPVFANMYVHDVLYHYHLYLSSNNFDIKMRGYELRLRGELKLLNAI